MATVSDGAQVASFSAERQLQMILGVERRQQPCVQRVLEYTHAVAGTALLTNLQGPAPIPYSIVQFGSRVYGNAVPSSDVDVVCELPYNLHEWGLDKVTVLERFLYLLSIEPLCTGVTNAIEGKKPLAFALLTCHATSQSVLAMLLVVMDPQSLH